MTQRYIAADECQKTHKKSHPFGWLFSDRLRLTLAVVLCVVEGCFSVPDEFAQALGSGLRAELCLVGGERLRRSEGGAYSAADSLKAGADGLLQCGWSALGGFLVQRGEVHLFAVLVSLVHVLVHYFAVLADFAFEMIDGVDINNFCHNDNKGVCVIGQDYDLLTVCVFWFHLFCRIARLSSKDVFPLSRKRCKSTAAEKGSFPFQPLAVR